MSELSKVAYFSGAALALYKLGLDAESFVEAVDEEQPGIQETTEEDAVSSEADESKSPHWSNSSSLEAGDVATRQHEMGLPSFGGV